MWRAAFRAPAIPINHSPRGFRTSTHPLLPQGANQPRYGIGSASDPGPSGWP